MKKLITLICLASIAVTMLSGCAKKKETIFITNIDDLNGKKIGVQEGTTGDIYATNIEGAELSRFKKAVDAAIDLKNGKIDAVLIDEQPAKKIVENNKDLMILEEEFITEDYAIAVAKGNELLLRDINNAIARMKADGSFQTFLDAYIPANGDPVKLEARTATNFADKIVMGTNAEFEPFEFRDGEKIVGFDIEMAYEIAKDLKMELVIEDMNFDSLITALASGKVDMVLAGMTVTDERKESVDFSDSYYTSKQVIIIRKTSKEK